LFSVLFYSRGIGVIRQHGRGVIYLGQRTDTLYTVVLGWFVSSFVYMVGGVDKLFIACVIFVAFDYITGVIAAWYTKELSSRKSYWGIIRKSLMLIPIIIAHQLDLVAGNEAHFMRNAMLMFLIATEGISIFENLKKLGIKSPPFIMDALKKLSGNLGRRKGD
jgi:toxin secretion/phage lysis holin